jgi:hypothetical protein
VRSGAFTQIIGILSFIVQWLEALFQIPVEEIPVAVSPWRIPVRIWRDGEAAGSGEISEISDCRDCLRSNAVIYGETQASSSLFLRHEEVAGR